MVGENTYPTFLIFVKNKFVKWETIISFAVKIYLLIINYRSGFKIKKDSSLRALICSLTNFKSHKNAILVERGADGRGRTDTRLPSQDFELFKYFFR